VCACRGPTLTESTLPRRTFELVVRVPGLGRPVSAARLDDLVRSLQRWAKERTERQEAHDRESGQKDGLDEETEALLAEFRKAADADRADEQFATIAERERARESRERMDRRRARAGELMAGREVCWKGCSKYCRRTGRIFSVCPAAIVVSTSSSLTLRDRPL
jgi:hypothetical protein